MQRKNTALLCSRSKMGGPVSPPLALPLCRGVWIDGGAGKLMEKQVGCCLLLLTEYRWWLQWTSSLQLCCMVFGRGLQGLQNSKTKWKFQAIINYPILGKAVVSCTLGLWGASADNQPVWTPFTSWIGLCFLYLFYAIEWKEPLTISACIQRF